MATDIEPSGPATANGTSVFVELGNTALRRNWGKIRENWHPKLRDFKQEIEAYLQMLMHPVIGAPILMMRTWIVKTPVRVRPPKAFAEDARAKKLAERYELALHDMDHTFTSYREQAQDKLWAGCAPFEIVWKVCHGQDPGLDEDGLPLPRSKYSDGFIAPHKIAYRPPESIEEWDLDDKGTILGLKQNTSGSGVASWTAPIPADKLLLHRINVRKNNPQGQGLCKVPYIQFFRAEKLDVLECVGHEKDVSGTPVLRAPEKYFSAAAGSTERQRLTEAHEHVGQMRIDPQMCVSIPSGDEWSLDLLGSNGAKLLDLRTSIKDRLKLCLMGMLSEAQAVGMDKVGTESMVGEKKHTLGMALEHFEDTGWDEHNLVLPVQFAVFNGYPPEMAPVVERAADIVTPTLAEVTDALCRMVDSHLVKVDADLEAHSRKLLKAPPPKEEDGAADAASMDTANTLTMAAERLSGMAVAAEAAGDSANAVKYRAKVDEILARI